MLTQCPKCGTIYQLGASDLSAAQGFVECGECATQFNALERLADEPTFQPGPSPSEHPEPESAVDSTDPGPAFVLIDPAEDLPVSGSAVSEPSPVEPSPVESSPVESSPVESPPVESSPVESPPVEPPPVEPPPVEVPTEPPEFDIAADRPGVSIGSVVDPEPAFETDYDTTLDENLIDVSTAAGDHGPRDDTQSIIDVSGFDPDGAARVDSPSANAPVESDEIPEAFAGVEPTLPADAEFPLLRPATTVLSESEHAILFTEPETETDADEFEEAVPEVDLEEVPDILREEVAALHRQPRRGIRWLWVVLGLLLTAALFAQIAYFLRDDIVAAVPELAPLRATMCEYLRCPSAPAEPVDIELVARDVRDHPRYRDALLVNATLVSRASGATPFPVIQLGLQGPTGEIIGVRRFAPDEYLDKSIDIAAGMPPERAVYVVLEVHQSGDRAVSFEFDFL